MLIDGINWPWLICQGTWNFNSYSHLDQAEQACPSLIRVTQALPVIIISNWLISPYELYGQHHWVGVSFFGFSKNNLLKGWIVVRTPNPLNTYELLQCNYFAPSISADLLNSLEHQPSLFNLSNVCKWFYKFILCILCFADAL